MKNLIKNITIIREDHHPKNGMHPPCIMQKVIAKNKMVLYSSTSQESGARKNWEKLQNNGKAEIYQPKHNKHPIFKFK